MKRNQTKCSEKYRNFEPSNNVHQNDLFALVLAKKKKQKVNANPKEAI